MAQDQYFTLPHKVQPDSGGLPVDHQNSANFEKDQTTVPIQLVSQIMSKIHGFKILKFDTVIIEVHCSFWINI